MPRKTNEKGLQTPPFPWQCPECGKRAVVLAKSDYEAEVNHDGKLYSFMVTGLTAPTCDVCGAKIFTEAVDEQINDAFRAHIGLLTPAQLREAIKRIGISQKDLSEHLGIAEATVSRWLCSSQIQSRAMDKLLRIFLAFPVVRQVILSNLIDLNLLGLNDISGDAGIAVSHSRFVSRERSLSQAQGSNWGGMRERCSLAQEHIRTSRSLWSEAVR